MKKIVALTTLFGLSLEGMPIPITNNIIPINEQPINNVIPMANTGIVPGINGNGNFLGGVGVGVAVPAPAPVPIFDNGFNGNDYHNHRDRKRRHNKKHRRRNHSRNYDNHNMNDIHWDNYY